MPSYYPVYLNLAGKRCVILGGGMVAEGKVSALLDAGVQLTVISPQASRGIQAAARRGDLEWQQRVYQPGDLQGAALVIAATNVWSVNQEICQEAEGLGILLNVADDPDLCNFIAPALVKRGAVTLAISTGGASPALARKLRETLSQEPVLEWADLAEVLARVRQELKLRRAAVDPERWQCCLTPDLLELNRQGREGEIFSLLLSRLQDGATPDLCPQLGHCQPGGCNRRARQRRHEARPGESAGRPRASQEPSPALSGPRGGEE
ncbi:MAG: bifunctional precorrin-2 dehydrogenase/sirohydrochlorin ferrochelatase [Dehalococcoidia bacterium]|nr:bifunctional precorrin-2 dehydrogenase/sirohydrochlorin ferrochelatase [Dehalococcoidia bacterium]MSQ17121.1 bifunctional precorrin-2 dehydrogenase/sirohydrochlorin ferrochelatase [Dehalococcoidia bacterium]